MKTALYGSTTMVLLGTYAFNSWDVGMTEFVARLWAQ
jgi:hypothetical protein